MNKGFVILAQNTAKVDYVECATKLSNSIKRVMPDSNVTIITELPYGDQAPISDWKLINDWQVYNASPYEYTIKLEADMFISTDISYWFDVLKDRDLVVSTTIRNFKNEISDVKAYRKFITDNILPDVYNAVTYFKKSELAEKFFKLTRNIWENWEEYKTILRCDKDEIATTDWVYSIACHIMGVENTTLPSFTQMSMVHMKQYVNDLFNDDWTKEMIYEYHNNIVKINTVPQQYPFHYHVKDFAKVLK